jgi:16S rRNA (guanine966-N2)-methyltransferase
MSIRVIAGIAKGRRLKLVPGDTTRPVMDRVKEALFSILGREILDATFLDLFAGTGSVGIEALSRGAKQAVFIDLERKAVQTIQENLALTKLADKAVVRQGNALHVLKHQPTQVFDFIYVAPPQYKGLWLQTLSALDANPVWISPNTTVIVQIDPSEESQVTLQHLELNDQRRYGNTSLWFFDLREVQSEEEPQEKSS